MADDEPAKKKRRYGRDACDQIIDEIDAFLEALEKEKA